MSKLFLTNASTNNFLGYKASNNTWICNKEEVELDTAVVHPDSLKTGWGAFAAGSPPDLHWDEALGKPGKPPTEQHKRCFSIDLETEANGKMTWSGTGHGQCVAVEALISQISASESDHPGKVPVVKYTVSEVKKVGMGQTRIPKFKIIGWVDPAFPPWKLQTEANDTPF